MKSWQETNLKGAAIISCCSRSKVCCRGRGYILPVTKVFDTSNRTIMADDGWSKEDIMDIIVREPDRVQFASFSKKRPHFRKIMVDNEQTLFVKCLKCQDYVCKYVSKKGSGPLINHEKKFHRLDDGEEDDEDTFDEDLFPKRVKEDAKPKSKDPFNYPYMVWDHCSITGKKTTSGLEIRACNYCTKEVGASPAYATIHMKECLMVPAEVRNRFIKRTERKRRYDQVESEGEMSGDDDDDDQQEKVVKILTGLLTKRSGGDLTQKPLRNFTEVDFDRELKELAVKKARLEVKALEDGQREMAERCKMYKDIRKAVNVWIEKESNGIVSAPHVKEMLEEAFEDSVASHSINGQN